MYSARTEDSKKGFRFAVGRPEAEIIELLYFWHFLEGNVALRLPRRMGKNFENCKHLSFR